MSITIAQVSDTHLVAHPEDKIRGCNPYRTLQRVLDRVKVCAVDRLLLTGDLTEKGEAEAYGHLVDLLRSFSIPIDWLAGNHDSLDLAAAILAPVYPGVTDRPRSFPVGTWQLILLDSAPATNQLGEGRLSLATLDWLETELTHNNDRPTMLALHHHPLPVGIDWLDQIGVQNGQDLLDKIDRFPNVKIVTFGHIHWAFETHRWRGKNAINSQAFYGCPSSALQVTPPHVDTADRTEKLESPHDRCPGFRLITLYDDGTHATQIERILDDA